MLLHSYLQLLNSETVLSLRDSVFAVLSIIITLGLLSYSEKLNGAVKYDYEKEYGFGSWKSVHFKSLIVGAATGIVSTIGAATWNEQFLLTHLPIFGTVIGYIGMQANITDPALHKVDRYMLRIGYFINGILAISYLIKSYPNVSTFGIYFSPIGITYIALFGLFIFSSIGASDIRAIVMFLPFLEAIDMTLAMVTFIGITILTVVLMTIQKWKRKDPMYAVPILPYLVVPYIFITPLLPLFIEMLRIAVLYQ